MNVQRITSQLERQATSSTHCCLRILRGPDAGREVVIPPVGLVIGADPAAHVVLADPAVSGRHVSVVPRANGFEVTDLGSRNGTFLDGIALTSATVPLGSVLLVGTSLVQLLPGEERIAIEPSAADAFGGLHGRSPLMRAAFALLERAATSDASVLLTGESGTGKELAARAVHEHSRRRDGPFVVFDCGAASETLVESDLFGHLRGAFTGAVAERPGAFARAHQGTLFLDEIGDLPMILQPKLLRLLESGAVTPLGGTRTERYDVRVVAATHRDLWAETARGTFRADLYYRLAVVEVQLPPLRRRPEEIPALVRLFLGRLGAREEGVAGPNLEALLAYSWPGNVRELRNVVARAAALARPGASFGEMPILLRGPTNAPPAAPLGRADRPYHEAKTALLESFELEYLRDLLARHGDNLSEAARRAGLERKYLYRLLEKHGLLQARDGR
jgi:DNA-binding NtrC family response regulator